VASSIHLQLSGDALQQREQLHHLLALAVAEHQPRSPHRDGGGAQRSLPGAGPFLPLGGDQGFTGLGYGRYCSRWQGGQVVKGHDARLCGRCAVTSTLRCCCLHSMVMALNIRNPEANWLAAELAALAGESKTDAVILALQERLQRLRRQRAARPDAHAILASRLDKIARRCAARPMRDQRTAEQILGYDAHGLPSSW